LKTIKRWLIATVVENMSGRRIQTAEARRRERGTPQGGVISPLLANCYFRRFLLAWQLHGHQEQLDAYIVNYADDFVTCSTAHCLATLSYSRRTVGSRSSFR
jgi:retron-type reverse transcriptase